MKHASAWLTWIPLFALALAAASTPSAAVADDPALEKSFLSPPGASRPWAYWWWLNANVTRESITRDLEEMKAKGLGGFLLFDVTAYGHHLVPAPERKIAFMSPQWRELVHFAMTESARVGLEMSMNLSTCGGALQAPWPTNQHAPKQLIFTSTEVVGPTRLTATLQRPDSKYFWPVALVAARHRATGDGAAAPTTTTKDAAAALSADWKPVTTQAHRKADLTALKASIVADEVVDLTSKVDAQGRVAWDVPKGRWTLYRFGCDPIPGRGEDIDILNVEAVRSHFDRMGKAVLSDAGPLAGKTLTHFYNVSWEGTSPSWTPGFDKDFRKYRGYDIRTYLPVLAGMVVRDQQASERFRADYCRTLADSFLHNSYGQFTKLCHQHGMKWHSESGGPWRDCPLFWQGDQFAFWGRNDMPQGEFWWPNYRSNARRTAMAAHIYGKRLVSIEAFTHMQPHWTAYPASLKPLADAALCDGMNQVVWHTSSASPAKFGLPGIVYFAGTHLNRNVTWWPQAGAFLDYLGRCQHMLRQGDFVADVCAYTTTRNQKNWGREDRWAEKTTLVLPKGYTYDLLNTEVLVDRLTVEDGQLVLPGGMRYRILVIDLQEDAVPPEALKKIRALAEAGATVVLGPRRPVRSNALTNYPQCDADVRHLAKHIWGPVGDQPLRRTAGRGKLLSGIPMEQVFAEAKLPPDCAAPCDYIHRRCGKTDIYFLAGEGKFEATFRVKDREPELWDPATGKTRPAVLYRTTKDGRTVVPFSLPKGGSIFVVFRKPADRQHLVGATGPNAMQIESQSDSAAQLRLWQNGHYEFTATAGQHRPVDVAGLSDPLAIDGPWEVRFAPGWGAPESITFDRLIPWNEHPNESIKYFSGKATYRKDFDLTKQQAAGLVRLQLGQLQHIGQVRLNGKDLGIVWTNPWTVDLTGVAKAGTNHLEVDVVNLWANRLIGDAGLPPQKRKTKTNIKLYAGPRDRKLKACQGFASEHPLLPSGLIGPVRLEFGQRLDLKF